ncbi:MAG: 2-amino-4-hydroxy-6-hydroxymethyldihydropteridine diphosphokinase [Pseudomonadota bacterium]
MLLPAEVPVCIGLGANLGDPFATLEAALTGLAGAPHTTMLARSAFYRSAPLDAEGPDFINAVAWIGTRLSPLTCWRLLQSLEAAHQRERPYRNAPRTLDLDLLLWGDQTLSTPELEVPHPRMHQRAFVLHPLAELSPSMTIPGRGPLQALLAGVADQVIERCGPRLRP